MRGHVCPAEFLVRMSASPRETAATVGKTIVDAIVVRVGGINANLADFNR